MGQSISSYLKRAGEVRSVRQIRVIVSAVSDDPATTPQIRQASSALVRKLNQIIDLPIAKAAFLASIWRDFRHLNTLLEQEHGKLNLLSANGSSDRWRAQWDCRPPERLPD
jgi:hypothetical protein